MKLYDGGKSFEAMAEGDFIGRTVYELEIMYGQNSEKNKSPTRRSKWNGNGSGVGGSDA